MARGATNVPTPATTGSASVFAPWVSGTSGGGGGGVGTLVGGVPGGGGGAMGVALYALATGSGISPSTSLRPRFGTVRAGAKRRDAKNSAK